MQVVAKRIECPNCGADLNITDTKCRYCKSAVTITSMADIDAFSMPQINKYIGSYNRRLAADATDGQAAMSVGMCFLKLKLYAQAVTAFEKAMPLLFDSAELYFYTAVALFAGKRPHFSSMKTVDTAISYLQAACSIEYRPIFRYFEAYIRYDYYYTNYMNCTPSFSEVLNEVKGSVSASDKASLFKLLAVDIPFQF